MLDTAAPKATQIPAQSAAPMMQRVKGRALVSMGPNGLVDLHQSGSAKAMLPRVHNPVPEVVFLNTSGGLTGGDHLSFDLHAADHTALVGTTQTAERAYASVAGQSPAQVDVTLRAGAGAKLHWLPQETILFERSNLSRHTRAELAADAEFLCVEMLVLGRLAMGETLEQLHMSDRREIVRAGRSEFYDPLLIDAELLSARDHTVTLGGARAIATLGFFAPGAESLADLIKPMAQEGVTAGVSGWNGKLVIRARAADALPLRRYLAHILHKIRGADLPRVWQM